MAMPQRIDKGWQARWEMLKTIIEKSRREASEGSELREVFDTMLSTMGILEKADRPRLSRDCEPFYSPLTGDPRDVQKPLRVGMELPEGKPALPDGKKGKEYLTCLECGMSDGTVRKRICAYHADIWDKEIEETVCDTCEQKHKDEI